MGAFLDCYGKIFKEKEVWLGKKGSREWTARTGHGSAYAPCITYDVLRCHMKAITIVCAYHMPGNTKEN